MNEWMLQIENKIFAAFVRLDKQGQPQQQKMGLSTVT